MYTPTLQSHVRKSKLASFKLHNHHVLIEQIMSAAIHHILKLGPHEAIMKIGNFFQYLCSKAIDLSTIPKLLECIAEALCFFEM